MSIKVKFESANRAFSVKALFQYEVISYSYGNDKPKYLVYIAETEDETIKACVGYFFYMDSLFKGGVCRDGSNGYF